MQLFLSRDPYSKEVKRSYIHCLDLVKHNLSSSKKLHNNTMLEIWIDLSYGIGG